MSVKEFLKLESLSLPLNALNTSQEEMKEQVDEPNKRTN